MTENKFPSWYIGERFVSLLTDDQKNRLKSDRNRFLIEYFKIVPKLYLAATSEHGPRGWDEGQQRTPIWLRAKDDPDTQLPEADDPFSILMSPVPCERVRKRQNGAPRIWSENELTYNWPFAVVDIDYKDVIEQGRTMQEVLDSIMATCPEPWCVVNSGSGGVHVWWAFDRPVHAHTGQQINKTIAATFLGDMAQTGARPSLRLPGSLNIKWAKEPPQTNEDLKLCLINHELSSWTRCSPEDMYMLPKAVPEHIFQATNRIDGVVDCPEWVMEAFKRADMLPVRTIQRQRGVAVVPHHCPECGAKGTAHVYVDTEDPKFVCKRGSCKPTTTLRKLAKQHGVKPSESHQSDEDFNPAQDHQALQNLTPPTNYGMTANDDTLQEEQQRIRKAAQNSAREAARTLDARRYLTVVESGTGSGKDYNVGRVWADAAGLVDGQMAIYGPTLRDLKRKADEWPDKNQRFVNHASPLYLVGPNEEQCRDPERIRPAVESGWGASRMCKSCPYFETCEVKNGFIDMLGDQNPAIHAYTTHRFENTRAHARSNQLQWVDENFQLVGSYTLNEEQIQRAAKSGSVPKEVKGAMRGLLRALRKIPDTASTRPMYYEQEALERFLSEVDATDALEPWELPSGRDMALAPGSTTKPAYPSHVYEVAWWVSKLASGARVTDLGALLHFNVNKDGSRHVTAYEAYLPSRLSKSTLWTNATAWTVLDIIEPKLKDAGVELIRAGSHLEPPHLHRIALPYRRATRGNFINDTKTGLNPAYENLLKNAIDYAKQRYTDLTGDDSPKTVLATYKAISDSINRDVDYRHQLGLTDANYYEAMVGSNQYSDYDVLVCFGSPNPNLSALDLSIRDLYGENNVSMMKRKSLEVLQQTEGRLRAVRAESEQVVLYVTQTIPMYISVVDEQIEERDLLKEEAEWALAWKRIGDALGYLDMSVANAVQKSSMISSKASSPLNSFLLKGFSISRNEFVGDIESETVRSVLSVVHDIHGYSSSLSVELPAYKNFQRHWIEEFTTLEPVARQRQAGQSARFANPELDSNELFRRTQMLKLLLCAMGWFDLKDRTVQRLARYGTQERLREAFEGLDDIGYLEEWLEAKTKA